MKFIRDRKILMSMRAAQFAGPAIEKNESRIYNCSYLPVDHHYAFSEIMFLLLGGTGVGFSVQKHHIEKLPEIRKPAKDRKFLVNDSIEGWADAVKALMKAYFGYSKTKPRFDYSDIRQKGARLVTAGGKAPGPEPLKRCLFNIELILERKTNGEKLTSLEVHDIVCHIADAVLAGGIRRAALISLFSADDETMATCKYGSWWETNPQRGRANNSAVILRHKVDREFFLKFWKQIKESNAGEPGIYFSNDKDYGTNPLNR
jgi:ribonucleoside-diphosphate reductase alpha chain